jgi:antitoxin YefM
MLQDSGERQTAPEAGEGRLQSCTLFVLRSQYVLDTTLWIDTYISLYDPTKSAAMSHVSYTDLRARLAAYMDEVCDSHAPLHVTRQNARTVVMMSEEEYDGLMETLHLLRSPANAARLLSSIDEADAGKLMEREIVDAPAK